jgi:Zn-dependent peptidase ImmA (M78 family)/transcriptional regulator with XRE-family HTH domain
MKLPVKGKSLAAIREARGYSESDVAQALDLSVGRIRNIESGSEIPTKGIVSDLAELFYVPLSLFFAADVSLEKNIADFRTTGNAPAKVGKSGLKQIGQCTELQNVLFEVIPKLDLNFFSTNIRLAVGDDVDGAANLVSAFLNLDSYNFFGQSDPRQLFLIVRKAIEKKKISVLVHRLASETFRGFCLAEKQQVPIIFINSFDQTDKTKLFTLVHELAHVFIRRDGVSDPFESDTSLERFCNAITARVLMPESSFRNVYSTFSSTRDAIELTREISERMGLSLHAIALRIEELNLRKGFYGEWRQAIRRRYKNAPLKTIEEGRDDPGDDEEVEFIARPSAARRLVSRFGYRLPLIFDRAIGIGLLSPQDGERLAGISPTNLPRAKQMVEQEFGGDI